jgi:outer membrane immunogenic protein
MRKGYRRVLGLAAVVAMATTGAGAGGSIKDDVRPFSWSGPYIGIHVGVGLSDVDWTFVGNTRSDHDGDGLVAGGQVGYNWQVGGIVLGVEADASWASIQGDAPCPNPAFKCGSDINRLASIRGRLGFTPLGPRSLLYGTAGWGWADVTYEAVPHSPGGFVNSVDISGWVVGGGLEVAHTSNVSLKLEYLAYLFDEEKHSSAPLAPGILAEPTVHTFKFGLNYRF